MNIQSSSPEQQQSIMDKCRHPQGSWEAFPDTSQYRGITSRFLEIVARHPERLALHTADHQLTYCQLAARASEFAHALRLCNNDKSKPVAVMVEDGPESIAAMLGILLAGRFFLIVNTHLPHDQIEYILKDSGTRIVLTDDQTKGLVESLTPPETTLVNMRRVTSKHTESDKTQIAVEPSRPVWLCYTSGSTGRPKGVLQTHGNLLHFVRADSNSMHISPEDRFALLFSYSANIASHTIFNALLNGASLFLWNLRIHSALSTITWLREHEITQLWVAPTVAAHLFSSMADGSRLESLRIVRHVGEATRQKHVALFHQHTPRDCVLINRFGASESGPACQYFITHDMAIGATEIPVGYAVEGNEIVLMNDNGDPAPKGEEGEIVVRSRYLSPGYWNLPERTAATFKTDTLVPLLRLYHTGDWGKQTEDGCLIHLGRKDYQIKIDGNKVHLQALESLLSEHPAVAEAAVWPYSASDGTTRIAGYFVPMPNTVVTVSDLRSHLARRFPNYAIPSQFRQMAALPRAANGKLYRPDLPPPDGSRPRLAVPYAAPVTIFEQRIADIWQTVLELDGIGIHDPFLELGGNSLQATSIASRVQEAFGVKLPLSDFFAAATIAESALLVLVHIVANTGMKEHEILRH